MALHARDLVEFCHTLQTGMQVKYLKAWFKRRILHAPNQILILVDSNEYVRLIWFKRRIVLPNKIAEHEWCVLNSHLSKHKLFNLISIHSAHVKCSV